MPIILYNHFLSSTFIPYNAPHNAQLSPEERLHTCHNAIQQVNGSLITQFVFPWVLNLVSYHVRPVAHFGLYNREFITGVSNLPIPASKALLFQDKYRITQIDFSAGPIDGVNGKIF